MRLVKRQELMTLPKGTLFAELQQQWVFGDVEIKGDTCLDNRTGENCDFWVLTLAWPEADDTGQAIDRLEQMAANPTVSYPPGYVYARHGLYDDDRPYLVYEKADVDNLMRLLHGVDGNDIEEGLA